MSAAQEVIKDRRSTFIAFSQNRRTLQERADRISSELKDLYVRTRQLEREQNEVYDQMRKL